jgi:hypothetical protein
MTVWVCQLCWCWVAVCNHARLSLNWGLPELSQVSRTSKCISKFSIEASWFSLTMGGERDKSPSPPQQAWLSLLGKIQTCCVCEDRNSPSPSLPVFMKHNPHCQASPFEDLLWDYGISPLYPPSLDHCHVRQLPCYIKVSPFENTGQMTHQSLEKTSISCQILTWFGDALDLSPDKSRTFLWSSKSFTKHPVLVPFLSLSLSSFPWSRGQDLAVAAWDMSCRGRVFFHPWHDMSCRGRVFFHKTCLAVAECSSTPWESDKTCWKSPNQYCEVIRVTNFLFGRSGVLSLYYYLIFPCIQVSLPYLIRMPNLG